MPKIAVDNSEKGIVFNMQRFSVNDGPGIRTIVFLQGCPLSCRWCSNPESQSKSKQIMFNAKNCVGCGKCKTICKRGAIDFNLPYRINRDKCVNCGACAENCYPGALVMSGKEMTVGEVIEELKKESINFRRSNGGVTLSGGEPLLQHRFAAELLKACKSMGWHTAIETTVYASEEVIDEVIPWVDLVLMDIKNIDANKHLKYTGVSNELILKNALKIAKSGTQIIVRVPVIPGFNADEKSIYDIAQFAKKLETVNEVHLLPYHKLGVNKYACIGRKYKIDDKVVPPKEEIMEKFKTIVENIGLNCNVGAH